MDSVSRQDTTERPERRESARFRAGAISANLRLRGRLSRLTAEVLDFNRYGMALLTRDSLPKDRMIYLKLNLDDTTADVVGVVHNCVHIAGGYRCGIRFRTQSRLQDDGERVELSLVEMETRVSQPPSRDETG